MRQNSKRLIFAFTIASTALCSAITPSNPDLIPAGREILDYFEAQYGNNHISGMNIYPRTPNTYLSTGKRGVIWMRNAEFIKSSDVDKMIVDYHKHRPIFCFGWHWALGDKWSAWGDPINRSDPDPYPQELEVARVLNPSTPEHAMMLADLDEVASWLQRFEDAGIPILWRGLHEHGGGWFWYDDNETPENSAELWRFVYDYFTHVKGLDNLIWYYNAGPGIQEDWDYRKRFYPGNDYVDFVDVNMYQSDHKVDVAGQFHYFDMMTYITDGQKMIGGGDQPNPHNPDYMAEGRFPAWLLGTPWEGAPFLPETRGYSIQWARYFYKAENVITLDEAPAFGASLGQPDLYPNVYPEIGIIHPEFQTWTHEGDPVIRAEARDRQGFLTQVEFFAHDLTDGTVNSIGYGTSIGNDTYELLWTSAPAGFYRISAKATDNSGNVSDTMDMGDTWPNDDGWKNFACVTKGYFNLAKFKPCDASSTLGDRVASRATDGNYESEWESNYLADGDTQSEWIRVDLGGTYSIDQVNIRWHWKAYASDFVIDVFDGSNWTPNVYSEDDFQGETTYAAVSVCRFPEIQAQQIRIRFTDMTGGQNHLYFGYKIAEIEVPVALAQTPANTPRHLELHNRRDYWKDQFARTAFGTPSSVQMTGTGSYDAKAFRVEYFDHVGEQLCARADFGPDFGQLVWRPYDNSPRDMQPFSNGHLHFWARANTQKTFHLSVRDTGGVSIIRILNLTTEWQRFVVPVSEIDELVDLGAITEPFIISKGGDGARVYLRQVYWSSEPYTPSSINIIDPSFDLNDTAFPVPNKPNFANREDRGDGWLAGELNNAAPRWHKNTVQDRAQVVDGRAQGMVQVIYDKRQTAGRKTFSLKVNNVESDGTPNYFKAMIFGVNADDWKVELITFSEPEFGLGPVDGLGPVGELLATVEVNGENLDETTLSEPADFAAGFDEIIILFWTEGVNPANGDVLWVDDVSIDNSEIPDPDPQPADNPIIDPAFDGGLTVASGSWMNSNDPSEVGTGWQVQAADGPWTYNAAGGFATNSGSGAPAMAQIIHDQGQTTGLQNVSFRLANQFPGNIVEFYIWGVNEAFGVSLYERVGPRTSAGNIADGGVDGAELLADRDLNDGNDLGDLDWPDFATISYDNASGADNRVNFGNGYEYLVVLFYVQGTTGDGEYVRIDDVVIGGNAPDPEPDPDPEPTDTILETFDWADDLDTSLADNIGTATGADGLLWTYNRVGEEDSKSITGTSLILQRKWSETTTGWIEAQLPTAITGFKLKFLPRYGGKSQIRVTINGEPFNSVIADGHTDLRTMEATVSAPAGAIIRIESIGNPDGTWKDVVIDDLELLGSGGGGGVGTTLQPTDDHNTTLGDGTSDTTSAVSQWTRFAMKFDLGSVGQVDSATLRVYRRDSDTAANTVEVYAGRTDAWNESSPNADIPIETGGVLDAVNSESGGQWLVFDVTSLVAAEAAGDGTVTLVLRTLSDTWNTFVHTRQNPDNPPELVINGGG